MFSFLNKGGWLMYVILFISILSFTVFVERIRYLKDIKKRSRRLAERVRQVLKRGDLKTAISICEKSKEPIAKVLLSGLKNYNEDREYIIEVIKSTATREIPKLGKNLGIMSTSAAIAPLIGLLGTVFGMIQSFHSIELEGTGKPQVLAGGISVALLTTAFGLTVAIPTIVAYNYLTHLVDQEILYMEEEASFIVDFIIKNKDLLKRSET
ncbi:MAG TPA: MotA/TolQ/ExbB proton channel family protein [Candidatus Atribacteria bacterium]|nr:MotA/TolQ/ExbB proton channel family protein [Candidatus Atribacteria bacterium]